MQIQERWIDTFVRIFQRCAVVPGEVVWLLSETDSRAVNVKLAELALARMGAIPVHIVVPTLRIDRKSTRLNSSHSQQSRMPSSA